MAKQEVVVIYDRKKVAAKRGKGKVEVRVYISRTERKYISLGDVAPDELENFVSSSKVLAIKKRCEQILAAMSVLDDKLSVEKFDSYYYETEDNPFAKSKGSVNFLLYMEQSIKQENIREGTRKHKICTLEAIRCFGQIKTTKDLTRENLVAFDQWLRDGTRSDVSINNYHKNFRIYTKRLATENVIDVDPYDLVKFKRGKCKEREPLSETELKKLRTIKLEGKLDKVRDLFVFAAYTGLAYCDVQSFSFDTMTELQGTLYYIDGSRLKTGSKFFTPILKPAMEVLQSKGKRLPASHPGSHEAQQEPDLPHCPALVCDAGSCPRRAHRERRTHVGASEHPDHADLCEGAEIDHRTTCGKPPEGNQMNDE